MEKIVIQGGNTISGTIKINGAKNSAVALLPAAILSDEEVTIKNIPDITDVKVLKDVSHCVQKIKQTEIIDRTSIVDIKLGDRQCKY